MKIFCKTLVLIFVVCCSCSDLIVRIKPVEIESRKREEPKSKEVKLKPKEEKTAPKNVGEYKDEKAKKPSAAEEKIRGFIAKGQEESKTAKAEKQLIEEITGLIIEQTMTKIGYDFYEYFFLFWKPAEVNIKDYNILIIERASSQWGSWVEVEVNGTVIWNRVLRPRSEEIEDAAKQAIEATKEYLNNYDKHQFQTEDVGDSGI
jgi:curli production assembly/transport component CsgE